MSEKTEVITVEVPEYLLIGIRKQIAEGKFQSESEAIASRLRESDDYSWLPDSPIDGLTDEEWTAEIHRRIEEAERGDTQFLTLDEVRASLRDDRVERDAA